MLFPGGHYKKSLSEIIVSRPLLWLPPTLASLVSDSRCTGPQARCSWYAGKASSLPPRLHLAHLVYLVHPTCFPQQLPLLHCCCNPLPGQVDVGRDSHALLTLLQLPELDLVLIVFMGSSLRPDIAVVSLGSELQVSLKRALLASDSRLCILFCIPSNISLMKVQALYQLLCIVFIYVEVFYPPLM